jgi:hypothetical protein
MLGEEFWSGIGDPGYKVFEIQIWGRSLWCRIDELQKNGLCTPYNFFDLNAWHQAFTIVD